MFFLILLVLTVMALTLAGIYITVILTTKYFTYRD